MDKLEWVQKIQKMGLNVSLENNVIMLRTDDKNEAIKFKKALKDYPCSWGIKVKRDEQDGILQDTEECGDCIEV